jgi:hypothetical protein
LSWQETVAVADVIQAILWTTLSGDEQERVLAKYWEEFELPPESQVWVARYSSLETLAWFFEGWPRSSGSAVAMELLARWIKGNRTRVLRHPLGIWADPRESARGDLSPRIQKRLRTIYEGAISSAVP